LYLDLLFCYEGAWPRRRFNGQANMVSRSIMFERRRHDGLIWKLILGLLDMTGSAAKPIVGKSWQSRWSRFFNWTSSGNSSSRRHILTERRQAVRRECSLAVRCRLVAPGMPSSWTGAGNNLSTEGIGLVFPKRCDPGTLIQVEMRSPDKKIRRTRLVLLKHQQPEADDTWTLGGEFNSTLSFEDMQELCR
jgi:PilZ domain